MIASQLDKFIRDLDQTTLGDLKRLYKYASDQARDYETSISDRPVWKDMARLIRAEIKRYG